MPCVHVIQFIGLDNYDTLVTQRTLVTIPHLPYTLVLKLISENHHKMVSTTSIYMIHPANHLKNYLKDHNPLPHIPKLN